MPSANEDGSNYIFAFKTLTKDEYRRFSDDFRWNSI